MDNPDQMRGEIARLREVTGILAKALKEVQERNNSRRGLVDTKTHGICRAAFKEARLWDLKRYLPTGAE